MSKEKYAPRVHGNSLASNFYGWPLINLRDNLQVFINSHVKLYLIYRRNISYRNNRFRIMIREFGRY